MAYKHKNKVKIYKGIDNLKEILNYGHFHNIKYGNNEFEFDTGLLDYQYLIIYSGKSPIKLRGGITKIKYISGTVTLNYFHSAVFYKNEKEMLKIGISGILHIYFPDYDLDLYL